MDQDPHIKAQSIPRACLILAANALGRPEDIPARSLAALRDADVLVFEEDRPARLCLKTAGVHRPFLKLTEHDEADTLTAVRESLKNKQTVCYMSDQGLPTLADPGAKLLDIAYAMGARVTVIPGPSSISTALAACPFLGKRFTYHGFLSQKAEERTAELAALARQPDPIVILDTPYRLRTVLRDVAEAFGGGRQALLALDITGPAEDFRVASVEELARWAEGLTEKLNFVLIVKGTGKSVAPGDPRADGGPRRHENPRGKGAAPAKGPAATGRFAKRYKR